MKLYINNVGYDIVEGYTITENYNETLDSATVIITHLDEKLEIEPLDNVLLGDRPFLIDTYIERQVSIYPEIFEYQLNLVSETKLLEGIILPNLAITGPNTLKIWEYVNRYNTLYGEKVKTGNTWSNKWSLKEGFTTKFNVDCPEFQWNNPTLREVLTDLMMVVDCIPKLEDNKIGWLDLSEVKEEIDTTGVNYIQRSQSLEDYASEIRMDMVNVMQTNVPDINNIITTTEYIPLTSESGVITTENMVIKTQLPILRIKSFKMFGFKDINENNPPDGFITDEFDLTNYIKEAKDYQTLKIAYRTTQIDTGSESEYQNYNAYYNRGSNVISGLDEISKRWFGNFVTNTLQLWRELAGFKESDPAGGDDYLYASTFFKIEYETLSDSVFSASKSIKPKHNRVIADNQTNSWVDAWTQGFLEYQKINRLGNQQLMINQRCTTNSPIEIAQTYGDNIVYRTECQYYNSHIEVNAIATKNYVLRNYFTGVKSKVRTWINAQDEALVRHELFKTYCEFSFNENSDYEWNDIFLTPFKAYTANPVTQAKIETNILDSNLLCNCITRLIGNSIVLSVGFNDNYITAKRLDREVYSDTQHIDASIDGSGDRLNIDMPRLNSTHTDYYGGIPLQNVKYVDDYGRFDTISVSFGNGVNYITDSPNINESKQLLWNLFQNGTVGDLQTVVLEEETKFVYKDNREIFKASFQYEYCSDDENIYVGSELAKRSKLIRTTNNTTSGIKIVDKSEFRYGSPVLPVGGTTTTYIVYENYVEIIGMAEQLSNKAIYFYKNDKILLAVKTGTLTEPNLKIYLNLKKYR